MAASKKIKKTDGTQTVFGANHKVVDNIAAPKKTAIGVELNIVPLMTQDEIPAVFVEADYATDLLREEDAVISPDSAERISRSFESMPTRDVFLLNSIDFNGDERVDVINNLEGIISRDKGGNTALLTVLATQHWMNGNDHRAQQLIDQARENDPSYSLAKLVDISLAVGAPVDIWVDEMRGLSREDCIPTPVDEIAIDAADGGLPEGFYCFEEYIEEDEGGVFVGGIYGPFPNEAKALHWMDFVFIVDEDTFEDMYVMTAAEVQEIARNSSVYINFGVNSDAGKFRVYEPYTPHSGGAGKFTEYQI
jgi:hypothetical protein